MTTNFTRKGSGSDTNNAGHFAPTQRRRTAIVLDDHDTHSFDSPSGMTGPVDVRLDEGTYVAEATRPIPVYECVASHRGCDLAEAERIVDTHRGSIQQMLGERYGSEFDDEDEGRWMYRFTATDPSGPEQARDALDAMPGISRSYNEEDHGTFGSENLGRIVSDELERLGESGRAPHTVQS